jgi:hypothetical protein
VELQTSEYLNVINTKEATLPTTVIIVNIIVVIELPISTRLSLNNMPENSTVLMATPESPAIITPPAVAATVVEGVHEGGRGMGIRIKLAGSGCQNRGK